MKTIIALIVSLIVVVVALPRVRREAYELPADAELLVGDYKKTFSCAGLKYGYYADTDNACRIFHVCHPRTFPDGTTTMEHYSFVCGNQTVFDQFSFTCADEQAAIPCAMAKDFYYLNDRLGIETELFHKEEDVANYRNIISTAFGARTGGRK